MSDLGRRRLAEIRTLLGWREAYKVAGLKDEGSDATKRRRLSRLINRKTSGAKELTSKEKEKINRAYRYREKKGTLIEARVQREVKVINRSRAEARKQAGRVFGSRGISPDRRKLERRLRQNQPLTDQDIQRIREGFENAKNDGGSMIRAEYARLLRRVNLTSLPPAKRADYKNRLRKAERAVERDEAQRTLEV